jgi:hypothetical protein
MRKKLFIIRVMQLLLAIGTVVREAKDLFKVYTDRGYGTGATALVEADLADLTMPDGTRLELSLADFNTAAGVLIQLLNFFGGKAITVADYEAVINRVRTDV